MGSASVISITGLIRVPWWYGLYTRLAGLKPTFPEDFDGSLALAVASWSIMVNGQFHVMIFHHPVPDAASRRPVA
jgi:hypothetical protein